MPSKEKGKKGKMKKLRWLDEMCNNSAIFWASDQSLTWNCMVKDGLSISSNNNSSIVVTIAIHKPADVGDRHIVYFHLLE